MNATTSLTERAMAILEAKMNGQWQAYSNAMAGGYLSDALEILEAYNATGFRLAKIRIERLRVNG